MTPAAHPLSEADAHYRRPLEPQVHIDHRPWGRFDLLALNEQVSVKILTVNPGARLSLQRHEMRDEWWHIMDDGLVVEIDGAERQVKAGDRVWIPRGVVHRVRNTENSIAIFVELAFGHFDEDDIERLEDDYARVGRATDLRRTVPEQRTALATVVTVVNPSFNERDNLAELARVGPLTQGHSLAVVSPASRSRGRSCTPD